MNKSGIVIASALLTLGLAAGAAMLLTPGTAPCTREDVERLFEMVPDPIDVDRDQWLSTQAKTSP